MITDEEIHKYVLPVTTSNSYDEAMKLLRYDTESKRIMTLCEIDFDISDPPLEPSTQASKQPVCESLADVNPLDVLCGRGGYTLAHVGNHRFRKLLQDFQPIYFLARRKEKPLLAQTIVLIIRKRGGRFLKKDAATGELYKGGNLKAQAKTLQALREGLVVKATKSAASSKIYKQQQQIQQEDEPLITVCCVCNKHISNIHAMSPLYLSKLAYCSEICKTSAMHNMVANPPSQAQASIPSQASMPISAGHKKTQVSHQENKANFLMLPPKDRTKSPTQSRSMQSLGKVGCLEREEVGVDVDDDVISTVLDSFSTVSIDEEHIVQQRSLDQANKSNYLDVKKVTTSHIFYFGIKVTDINDYKKYVILLMNKINHEDTFYFNTHSLLPQKVTLKYIHTNYRNKHNECIGYLYFKLYSNKNKSLVKFSHENIHRWIYCVLMNEFPNTIPRQGSHHKKTELIITGT